MKKTAFTIFSAFLVLCMVRSPPCLISATSGSKQAFSGNGSDDAYQQTIIELLMPQIDQAVEHYYKQYFYNLPGVAPYLGGKVLSIEHHESQPNISYFYEVVVQVMPYFGPHNAVGIDNLTFRVFAGGKVRLERFEHIESFEIPQRYRDEIISSWPPG